MSCQYTMTTQRQRLKAEAVAKGTQACQPYLLHCLCKMFVEFLFPVPEFLHVPLQVLYCGFHLRHLGL